MNEHPAEIVAYADGSCLGNPGPGGWGVVIIGADGSTRVRSGANPATTNNRMEITAAIEALRAFPPAAEVTIRTDSQYVVKTMTLGWKRRENLDLWRELDAEAAQRLVRWEWVRGHAGNEHNEHADELARSAAATVASAGMRAPAVKPRGVATREAGEDPAMAELESLLRPGETVRTCAACRAKFVAIGDSRYCSRAPCQVKARRGARE